MSHLYYISYEILNKKKIVKSGQFLKTSRELLSAYELKKEVIDLCTRDIFTFTNVTIRQMNKLNRANSGKGWNYVFE
jgi:hypothetical protein